MPNEADINNTDQFGVIRPHSLSLTTLTLVYIKFFYHGRGLVVYFGLILFITSSNDMNDDDITITLSLPAFSCLTWCLDFIPPFIVAVLIILCV